MGCSPSKVNPQANEASTPRPMPADIKAQRANGHLSNGEVKRKKQKAITDSNANQQDINTNNPVPKSVAFQLTLDGEQTDSLIMKHPPIKLKRLAPLNVPKLSAEELIEKQKIADEKREKELQRKKSASRKSSRRRRELLEAKKFEEQQQVEEEKNKIDTSLKTAELLRQAKLQEVRERQRIREERARRARERHKKIMNDEQEDIDMEKDNTFNADDDAWLDGEKKTLEDDFNSESGYGSSQKPLQPKDQTSASSSFKPPSASSKASQGLHEDQDDFFDS